WIGNLLSLEYLEIIPHCLVHEPEGHPTEHQNPKGTSATIRAAPAKRVGQKRGCRHEQQSPLKPVADHSKRVAARDDERGSDLCKQQRRQKDDPEFVAQRQAENSGLHSRTQSGRNVITRVIRILERRKSGPDCVKPPEAVVKKRPAKNVAPFLRDLCYNTSRTVLTWEFPVTAAVPWR